MMHAMRTFSKTLLTLALATLSQAPSHSFAAENESRISPPASERDDPGLAVLINRYASDRQAIAFKYREPLSPLRSERLDEFYRVQLAEFNAIDADDLSDAAAIDHALMKNELDFRIATARLEKEKDRKALALMPSIAPIIALLEQHESTHEAVPRDVAELMVATEKSIAEQVRKIDASTRGGGDPLANGASDKATETVAGDDQASSAGDAATATAIDPTDALRAADAASQLAGRLKAFHTFYSGYNPEYSWWCEQPYQALDKRISELRDALRRAAGDSDDPDKILGQPIGEEALQLELQHELIPYSPAELIEIAEREFQWCDREMIAASQEMGYGDDWRAAMEAVKQRHVGPGQQPAMIRRLALEAVEFIQDRDLVTVPPLCAEIWRMEMMTPARQRQNPFFLGGDTIIVSYPTDTMTHEEKLMSMRGNNEHFARATVHHELIPGHHLQMFMNERYRPYRGEFRTPFWIEGWALYWEMMLWDKNFARSAEDRIGMLFWRKHRCARIVFSLAYQLDRMTPDQCVDYLVDRVGHERLNAAAEVRRSVMGGYGALYQAAYMLGGLQIRALRHELVDSGLITERDFHDRILREGPIPIALVRTALKRQRPNLDNLNDWRFAD
jgi:uncharacterized protein (DUF885 family)